MKTSKENPNHVAIIMDGNGTGSEKNNLQKKFQIYPSHQRLQLKNEEKLNYWVGLGQVFENLGKEKKY